MHSAQSSLTNPPSLARTKIAFVSDRSGHAEIYLMNPDGTGQTRLTYNAVAAFEPAWSSDGTKIVFLLGNTHPQLYVINADGTNPTPLTNNTGNHYNPAWSSDGTKIVLSFRYDGDYPDIYVMNADGTDLTRLTRNTASDIEPSWSPDGTKIAFVSDRIGNDIERDRNFEIYVMNADGTDQTRLTHNTAKDSHPTWSPDGTKIAFWSNRDEVCELCVMNADGTNQTRLTHNTVCDIEPSWSPDGTKIAFMSDRDGNYEIYAMNADGTDQTRLTYNTAGDTYPVWSPFLPAMIPEILYIVEAFARPGGQALVEVRLHVNQPVTGIQFTIQPTLDGLPTVAVIFNGLVNDMASEGFIATFATDANGVTTVLLFSTSGHTIPPGEHTVFHLVYDIAPETPAGTEISLHVADDVLSSPDRQAIPHALHAGTIAVGRPGDLIGGPMGVGDGRIHSNDVLAEIDIILGRRSRPAHGTLEFFLADVNGDGDINILDVVEIVDLSLSGVLKRKTDRPLASVLLAFGEVQMLESGQLAIPVMMESDGLLAGLQMVITYTVTQLRVDAPLAVGPASGMTVAYHVTEEDPTVSVPLGTLQVMLYSATGQVIAAGRETILHIPVTVLREPSPIFPEDTVNLLVPVVLANCQAQAVPVVLEALGPRWVKVSAVPNATALKPNRPNPFYSSTQIAYDLGSPRHVTLAVYDLQEQEVICLVDEWKEPNRYTVTWDGLDRHGARVASGDYLYRLTTSTGFTQTRRLTLLG